MSLREASKKYDIPKSTLHDKIRCLKSGEEISLQPKIGRFTKTFPPEYEEQLVNHVKDLSNRCLPLMKKEFLKLAYDLAVELTIGSCFNIYNVSMIKLPHRFNTEKGTAGKHFYYDFMPRHSDLSLRTPESTSVMRAVGFNKPQVDLFFSNLEKLMNRYNFPSSNILYIISQKILKLSLFPDAAKKRSESRKRKSEKSAILTSSPYKTLVEEKENEKKAKESKKNFRQKSKKTNRPGKIKKSKALTPTNRKIKILPMFTNSQKLNVILKLQNCKIPER
ncbi:PREDICTED: uncharacterized protein LOC105564741 [Vollenhovia emeryi]|uniref:uncharacterized protein LOC105564741 n=1 Tax=Vollenhovia emeryi TaxID=411798 RepID=UPI0005F3BA62|nr:PREDICTED: uncharacterized protein LOC105564741 [Vollenhovia emeryi]